MEYIYIFQRIQISANICDFDKPTITRRKIIVLSRNLQKYLNFLWDAHIRHIPPSGVFPHLRHISSSVYVPWRLNRMKPVELEGQKQGKTKLLWPFRFIFVQTEKSCLFLDTFIFACFSLNFFNKQRKNSVLEGKISEDDFLSYFRTSFLLQNLI